MEKNICGVILAGGNGTRLRPATLIQNKHLLPLVNQPMVLFPLHTLLKMGITDICIVAGGEHLGKFAEFLGDGSKFGATITYKVQESAGGIAQALGLTKSFVGDRGVVTILGDNIFEMNEELWEGIKISDLRKAQVFLKKIPGDNKRFGVPELNKDGDVIGIEEKPETPKSDYAVTGLYYYPNDVFDIIGTLKPSDRGELEITDVNNCYIEQGRLIAAKLDNIFWTDCGTPESLRETVNWLSGSTYGTTALDAIAEMSSKLY